MSDLGQSEGGLDQPGPLRRVVVGRVKVSAKDQIPLFDPRGIVYHVDPDPVAHLLEGEQRSHPMELEMDQLVVQDDEVGPGREGRGGRTRGKPDEVRSGRVGVREFPVDPNGQLQHGDEAFLDLGVGVDLVVRVGCHQGVPSEDGRLAWPGYVDGPDRKGGPGGGQQSERCEDLDLVFVRHRGAEADGAGGGKLLEEVGRRRLAGAESTQVKSKQKTTS